MAVERVVVVGAGGISPAWFKPLKAEGVQVAAVVDLRLEQAQKRIAEFELAGAEASSDMVAMIQKHKPDFVIDLTIPEAHCETVCKALELGCHVVSEKPMASSMKEARKMVSAAEKTGKLYMVSQSRRWDAKHEVVSRVITGGALGALTTINCDFYIGAHFGGFRDHMSHVLLLDMAIHTFDAARLISSADPVAVYCHEWNPAGSWYDHDAAAVAIFEMSHGIVYTYRGSWCAEGMNTSWECDWRIAGTTGSVKWDGGSGFEAQVIAETGGFFSKWQDVELPAYEEPLKTGGHAGAIKEFVRCVQTGDRPETICSDNIKSLSMVFTAIESAEKGQRVTIKNTEGY